MHELESQIDIALQFCISVPWQFSRVALYKKCHYKGSSEISGLYSSVAQIIRDGSYYLPTFSVASICRHALVIHCLFVISHLLMM